jgi:hypothetical protein
VFDFTLPPPSGETRGDDAMSDYYYETTPYGVDKRGRKFVVVQYWWGKDISTHKTNDEAQAACVEEARKAGCLRRVKLRLPKKGAKK